MDKSLRILMIDDDAQIRFALSALAESQGWEPVTAADVEEGLMRFRAGGVGLVLIDYHLPGVNGVEGVRRIRRISQDVPIIVFTIDDDQAVADEFLRAGANDFALKPIKAPDLISRIRLHIRLMETQRAHEPYATAKGISNPTLELIERALGAAGEPLSVARIAEATGLASQTAYRYIQSLAAERRVNVINRYGAVGRPRQYFTLVGKELPHE